ncbi:MAG: AAA family ATPase [Alkaliphilus sp.]
MIIKKIELYNFRQYKGKQVIEFTSEKKRNVTVLIGKNTSGKTTLVQAFNWCLYEKSNFKSKDLVNFEVIKEVGYLGHADVYVEALLLHEGMEYIVRRSQRFEKNGGDRVKTKRSVLEVQYKDRSGSTQNIPDNESDNTINKILPVELSDYFFFDGERIGEINKKGDVVRAVRALMGLDAVCEARDKFDILKVSSVTSKFSKDLDLGADNKNKELAEDLVQKKEDLEVFEERQKTCNGEIDYYKERKKELSSKILERAEVKTLKEEEKKVDKDIIVLEGTIVDLKKDVKKMFGEDSLGYFAEPLIYKALKVISSSKADTQGIPEMRAKAIDHIIKRGTCICGKSIVNNNESLKNLLYEKKLLPPMHMGTIIGNYIKTLNRMKNSSEDFFELLMEKFESLQMNREHLDKKSVDKGNLQNKILEVGDADVTQLETDYRSVVNTLNNKIKNKEQIDKDIIIAENDIRTFDNQIDRLVLANEKNEKLRKCIDYSKALFAYFNELYSREEEIVKNELLESVNNNFKKIYHGSREVVLNDKYQIDLITKIGDHALSTDESKGLEAVKNFSFITGLVDLARERARMREGDPDNILHSEPYPLVMDAPFSNTDELHIGNIARVLPDSAEQVILILMNKDWEHAEKSLKDRVGAKYIIEKVDNSETYSCIKSS